MTMNITITKMRGFFRAYLNSRFVGSFPTLEQAEAAIKARLTAA